MRKSFITTIDAMRFERPLAAVLAASTIFLVMAVPAENLTIFPALTAFPGLQVALALIAGLLLGGAGYAAMIYPWPRRYVRRAPAAAPETFEDDHGQFAAGEVSLRLRRADRHPDAPARAPIFASRDLGSPFMEVGASAPRTDDDPAASEPAIPEGDYAEVEPAPVAFAPEAVEPEMVEPEAAEPEAIEPETLAAEQAIDEPVASRTEAVEPETAADAPAHPAEAEWPIADMPEAVAAFAPEEAPVPAPARGQRQSIAAMMDRLSAGLERRAASGDVAPLAQQHAPALRDALDELNRLAARRG